MTDNFKNLLKLLDDDSDQLAGIAMAELLSAGDPRLERVLRTLQESSNPKLRRRIHQLQSAIIRRKKRLQLADALGSGKITLFDAVLQLHLLWFDNDTLEEVSQQWKDVIREAHMAGDPHSFKRALLFLAHKITACYGSDHALNADSLCIGTILEDSAASDFMYCILGREFALNWGFRSDVITVGPDFALLSGTTVHAPCRMWKEFPLSACGERLRVWTDSELISLLASSLFLNAVATDGFRYVHTLGCCISGKKDIRFLPYPYGDRKI